MSKKLNKKTESRLKESEVRYRRLFETAHDGILILNSKTGQITDVNPFLEKLLGYSKHEFLNKKLWQVGAFKNMKAAKNAFKMLQNEGYLRYEDLPLETKDGRSIAVEFVSNSYLAGDTLVIQCNIRDITERKKMDILRESKKLLEEEKLKTKSIANVAHELRTPLAIIRGNVDLSRMKKGKTPRSALRAINHEVEHLSKILSDLTLVTSEIWESNSEIIHNELNLRKLISVAVRRCKVIAYKKKVSIIAKNIPNIAILGDEIYLEKMFVNLIKNSVTYGKKNGHTTIHTKKSDGFITIDIIDNGIGISKENLPHVFERFFRVNGSHRSNNKERTGLGLAIVKWIAEVHGGKISVKSKEGKGSTFSVSLPLMNATKG